MSLIYDALQPQAEQPAAPVSVTSGPRRQPVRYIKGALYALALIVPALGIGAILFTTEKPSDSGSVSIPSELSAPKTAWTTPAASSVITPKPEQAPAQKPSSTKAQRPALPVNQPSAETLPTNHAPKIMVQPQPQMRSVAQTTSQVTTKPATIEIASSPGSNPRSTEPTAKPEQPSHKRTPVKIVTQAQPAVAKVKPAAATPSMKRLQTTHNTQHNKTLTTRSYLSEIQQLVTQLKQAMARRDTTVVEPLLDLLEQRVGADVAVSLKMRAYWLLRQDKNTQAAELYQQLLKQQPNDQEANLNMALIELRNGERDKALARVSRLATIYPDSPHVDRFLQRLRRSHG